MVPIILFISVAAIGVLGIVAMLAVAKQQLVAWQAERARKALIAARVVETARLKAEHAEVLAKLAPQPVALPKAADTVSLTHVFKTLEESGRFKRPSVPVIAVAPPAEAAPQINHGLRPRMAKGSVPIPMKDARPAIPGAYPITVMPVPALPVAHTSTAPLTPVVTRPLSSPPPRRSSRSIPPPIPGFQRVRSGSH